MSLRNQPYIPLYVDDFLSDEKLIFCSAATTGVYIRLMCLMHKSEEYGKILLKQKFKQDESNLKNFASQLAVQLPYDYHTILFALEELVCSKVLQEEPCAISQRRMVKDNEISEKRALSGRRGGNKSLGKNKKISPENNTETDTKTDEFALNFAQAKMQANYVNGIVNGIVVEEKEKEKGDKGGMGEKEEKEKGKGNWDFSFVNPEILESFQNWLSYKAAKKQALETQQSVKACYSHLVNLAGNDSQTAKLIVEQSMANNWAGLFELKNRKNGGNGSSGADVKIYSHAELYAMTGRVPHEDYEGFKREGKMFYRKKAV
jgi:hypothetical protein